MIDVKTRESEDTRKIQVGVIDGYIYDGHMYRQTDRQTNTERRQRKERDRAGERTRDRRERNKQNVTIISDLLFVDDNSGVVSAGDVDV